MNLSNVFLKYGFCKAVDLSKMQNKACSSLKRKFNQQNISKQKSKFETPVSTDIKHRSPGIFKILQQIQNGKKWQVETEIKVTGKTKLNMHRHNMPLLSLQVSFMSLFIKDVTMI